MIDELVIVVEVVLFGIEINAGSEERIMIKNIFTEGLEVFIRLIRANRFFRIIGDKGFDVRLIIEIQNQPFVMDFIIRGK